MQALGIRVDLDKVFTFNASVNVIPKLQNLDRIWKLGLFHGYLNFRWISRCGVTIEKQSLQGEKRGACLERFNCERMNPGVDGSGLRY